MEPFNVLTQAKYGQVLYNRHDVFIGRSLELYGEWSEGELELFLQVLRPGMVVVDAGANIGTHTLALAAGPRRLAVVPLGAAVSPAATARLGAGRRAGRQGAGRVADPVRPVSCHVV